MKKFCILPLVAALAFFVSCQKQQTEEEKRAEVERQVQDRLTTERRADEANRLAQQKAELDAREKALANKEVATTTTTPAVERSTVTRTETTRQRPERRSETTATYGSFYQKLEPYGAWRETADYGFVWQPREAEESRDWRPYTEGRWAYSDAGWTWVSNERFGWATYHYGRWLRLRRVGWVWVPGDEWAPAWVSWRTSKNYVGWAPLPPEARFDRRHGIHNWADNYYDIGPDQYAFVRGDEFGSQQLRRSVVPAEQNVTIVNETTNVTNITYANTTIINQGPDYEEMRSRSRQPLERYRLRRQNEISGDIPLATVRGDELEITVSLFSDIPGFHRPRTVKERVSDVVIDTGWTAVSDRSAAERTRAKMNAEATPPPDAPSKKFVKPTETAPAASPTAAAASATPTATPTAASPTPTAQASASPTVSASPSERTRPSPSATTAPTSTVPAAASPTPTAAPSSTVTAASPTPTAPAATTPAATATAAASPSPSARRRPSPTITPTAAATATATATAAAVATPSAAPSPTVVASPTVRVRPSPSLAPKPSPTLAPAASPTPPAVATTPESPAAFDKAEMQRKFEASRKSRTAPTTPVPAATEAPLTAPASTPPATSPQMPRRIPPARMTPSIAPTSPSATTSAITTPPPITPPARKEVVVPPPPAALPSPSPTPADAAAATPPVPAMAPKVAPMPPVVPTTQLPATPPDPSTRVGADDKVREKKNKRPGPAGDQSPSPTPQASTAPN